jgi:nucleotide-binding universal stress UspA family protein
MNLERILVPVDFSSTSRDALALAASLARRSGGKLTLLHVGATPTYSMTQAWSASMHMPIRELHERMKRESQALVERWLQSDVPAGVEARTVLREGFPPDEIVAEADDHDLVVIGTHGRTGADRVALGSVAERGVRRCKVPVLVAPGVAREAGRRVDAPFENVLVAIDFSESSTRVLRAAIAMAGTTGAKLTLLHVVISESIMISQVWMDALSPSVLELHDKMVREAQRQLDRMMRDEVPEPLRGQALLREGLAANTIVQQISLGSYDLVVMGTHGHTGIQRVILGSVAERVLRHSPVPVLVAR